MSEELDLSGMALFVRIVEDGSLSAAGRTLGLPKATVSRRLAALEASIGTPLLTRSTRALGLTDTGRRFFERVEHNYDATAAQSEIRIANMEPAGLLRVTVPVAFGQGVIAPRLMRFLERHPRIQADLHFSDERVNIIARVSTLAIRMGDLRRQRFDQPPPGGYSDDRRRRTVLFGGPRRHQEVRDLKHHVAILTQRTLDHWTLGGETVRVPWRISTGSMIVTRDVLPGPGWGWRSCRSSSSPRIWPTGRWHGCCRSTTCRHHRRRRCTRDPSCRRQRSAPCSTHCRNGAAPGHPQSCG